MSIKANEVLTTLDEHINNEPLTGLSPMMFQLWTHFFPADTRLSVFRSENDWAVFVEIVCFRPGQDDSSLEIWGYSNCLSEPAFFWGDTPYEFRRTEEGQYSSYPETVYNFGIIWGEKHLDFTPTPEEYAAAGIVIAPDMKEQGNHVGGHILRLLCEQFNHPFFTSEAELREMLEEAWREGETPRVAEMTLLWQSERWRHPAIVGTDSEAERPRVLPYWQALARAIESGDVSELAQQDPATFNTDWRIWDAEERDQEEHSKAIRVANEAAYDQLPPEIQAQMQGLRGRVFISFPEPAEPE